ncbi:MAG: hypothetical protein K2V38_16485 [Gemmataceae bacterium]|nr:hypothetical protein [Gemmataceae bacterium]
MSPTRRPMYPTLRTRSRAVALAAVLYAVGVTAALVTGVSSALCVTPPFLAAVAWAFGLRAGAIALVGCDGISCAVVSSLPPGSGPPAFAVMLTVVPVDALLVGIAAALRRAQREQATVAAELRAKNAALESSLAEVKELRGMLPICAWCKCVRDVDGMWEQLERYLTRHAHATFTHGICPSCAAAVVAEANQLQTAQRPGTEGNQHEPSGAKTAPVGA